MILTISLLSSIYLLIFLLLIIPHNINSLSVTLIGASSTLGSYLIPFLPSHYTNIHCYTGPTKNSWSALATLISETEGGCKIIETKTSMSVTLQTQTASKTGRTYTISHYDPSNPAIHGDCVFLSPPSSFPSYPTATSAAVKATEDSNSKFILISSAGVYPDGLTPSGVPITPSTPLPPTFELNERQLRIYSGEEPVLSSPSPSSVVIRCSGLYALRKGAHRYWLNTGTVKGGRDGFVNLIHYADVARLIVKVLGEESNGGKVRIANDDREPPLTREGICKAAFESVHFNPKGEFNMPEFLDYVDSKRGREAGVVGKIYQSGVGGGGGRGGAC